MKYGLKYFKYVTEKYAVPYRMQPNTVNHLLCFYFDLFKYTKNMINNV
jgi:hypothetical protein